MLQIAFLGTSGAIPTVGRGMPAIALKYRNQLLLWDCGEGSQRQMMKYRIGYGSVNAIFISHPHIDHYLGLFGLLETRKITSPSPKEVDLFLPKPVEISGDYPFARIHAIKKGNIYSKQGFSVSAFPVRHSRHAFGFVFQEENRIKFHEKKAHSLGLKGRLFSDIQKKGRVKTEKGEIMLEDVSWIKPGRKIVYSGDCAADEGIIEAAKGADLLIHEATFSESLRSEALERLHSTAADAAHAAKKARVKKLVLTHVSPRYSRDPELLLQEAREIFSDVTVAEDGMIIDVE